MTPLWTVLGLFVLVLPPLHAQGSAVPPGTRVRVQPRCGGTDKEQTCRVVVGRLVTAGGDSLLIEDAQGTTRRIDLASGSRFERSVGYRRNTLLGLGIGTLAGLFAGAAFTGGCQRGGSDDELCGIYYFKTVPVGAALGTLIGALTHTERWEAVSASATSLRVRPLPGGAAVSLAIQF